MRPSCPDRDALRGDILALLEELVRSDVLPPSLLSAQEVPHPEILKVLLVELETRAQANRQRLHQAGENGQELLAEGQLIAEQLNRVRYELRQTFSNFDDDRKTLGRQRSRTAGTEAQDRKIRRLHEQNAALEVELEECERSLEVQAHASREDGSDEGNSPRSKEDSLQTALQ